MRSGLNVPALSLLQSDFLDFYVSYLREIPECLSVISMLASGSVPSSAFLEVTPLAQCQHLPSSPTLAFCLDFLTFSDCLHQCDILGDESRPSLYDLLLQPVQRIPDYLLLLQVS